MGYSTAIKDYKLDELDLSAAGQGPLLGAGVTARGAGFQNVGPNAGNISNNDLYPVLGREILKTEIVVRAGAAFTSGLEAYWGVGGAFNAAPENITPFAGFRVVDNMNIQAVIHDGVALAAVDTGLTLATDRWTRGIIDMYTGVQSRSMPNESVGGIGHVRFALENDRGQAIRVAETLPSDLSAHAAAGFQLHIATVGIGAHLQAKWATLEYRDQMGTE